jgi:hypothetical protein
MASLPLREKYRRERQYVLAFLKKWSARAFCGVA